MFEKPAEYRHEQLVFCHDQSTVLKGVMRVRDSVRKTIAIARRDGAPTNVAADTLALERIAAIGSMERLHTGHLYGRLHRRRETP